MIFFGCLAAFLCVFLLGVYWPHKNDFSFGVSLWGFFVKSLIISWGFFLLSFFTGIGQAAPVLVVLLTIGSLLFLGLGRTRIFVTSTPVGAFGALSTGVYLLALLFMTATALSTFGSIFVEWDAVVSWNRWAIELSNNNFKPMNAAYPILWPAVWSLIYEAQGTSALWYVAKASVAAPVIFFAFLAAERIRTNAIISGSILCILVYGLLISQSQHLVSGYMDIPVSLLGLGALLLLYESIATDDAKRRFEFLLLGALTVAAALLTKQAGMLFGALFGLFVLLDLIKKRISISQALLLFAIIGVPYLTYMYIHFDRQTSMIGNIEILRDIVKRKQGNEDKIAYAFGVLSNGAPKLLLGFAIVAACLNFIHLKKVKAQLGLAALVFAIGGFFIFADCCSYVLRNGFWIYSFLIMSAYSGVMLTEESIRSEKFKALSKKTFRLRELSPVINLSCVLGLIFAVFAVSTSNTQETLLAKHLDKQSRELGAGPQTEFLYRNRKIIRESDVVASYYLLLQHVPFAEDRFQHCKNTSPQCLSKAFSKKNVNTVTVFTVGWNETPKTRKYIESAIEDQMGKVVAQQGKYRLIQFTRENWNALKQTSHIEENPG